jgi:hypothetical protein
LRKCNTVEVTYDSAGDEDALLSTVAAMMAALARKLQKEILMGMLGKERFVVSG